MRMWSLHPRYLDRQGLIACWRETLLAQAVLAGATRGYRNHPQLERFRASSDPLGAVGAYLEGLADEADHRGYRFDRSRIRTGGRFTSQLEVSDAQLDFERRHLLAKLSARSPEWLEALGSFDAAAPHPLFTVVSGPIAPWERP